MSVAAPWMLIGLVSLAIPILLHIRRRREGVIRFPAVSVLKKVVRRRRQRLKLRKVLLLIARVLALAAAVLAVSRPGMAVRRPGGIRSGSALAQVVVLDDSLSMRLAGAGGEMVFDRAKELALTELDRLRPGDASALIFSGSPIRKPIPQVEFDLARVRRKIETARSSYLRGDLDGALRAAARMLEDSLSPQREVVVVTDLSEEPPGTHGAQWPPWSPGSGIGFRIIDAAADVPRGNVAVDHVRVSPSPEGVFREALIEARVVNHTDAPLKGFEVVLEVEGDELARGSLDVPPRESAIKRFYHRFEDDGVHRGRVRIGDDALVEDNVRHFAVVIRRSVNALVVDGDYRPGSYRDEAFYLHRALETNMPREVSIQSMVVDVDAAQEGPLAGHDVIFLAGVVDLPQALAERLVEFVHQGGGLFVSPGDEGGKLELIESILPAKVRSVRQVPRRRSRPFRVAAISRAHPVFQPFGSGPTGLEDTEVRAHLLVEIEPSADQSTLIELANGLPLLLEQRVGRGRVMLLTTTIDRDWTDLPIRPGYLPLVQRAARHLAGRLDDREPRRSQVGDSVRIEVSKGMQRLLVRGPREQDTVYHAGELADRSAIDFQAINEPGHYQVWAEIPGIGGLRELPALGFVAETDASESDTSRVISAAGQVDSASLAPIEGHLPTWPYLLVAAVLLLLFETWLCGQGLRRSHALRRG